MRKGEKLGLEKGEERAPEEQGSEEQKRKIRVKESNNRSLDERRLGEGGCHSMPWPPAALLLPTFLSRGESLSIP